MIHTYGGAEILYEIFTSLAMLLQRNGAQSIFYPLTIMGASFGVFWGISRAFFSPDTFITRFFLPFLVGTFLLLLPAQKTLIVDHMSGAKRSVSKVPFLLVRVAEISSSIGYYLDQSLRGVLHLSGSFTKESIVFGESPEFKSLRLSHANLERNMEHFCKNCVIYDVALKKYSLDELRKSTDLLKLFKEKTARSRSIYYCPLAGEDGEDKCEFLSCKEAIYKMEEEFESSLKEPFAWLQASKKIASKSQLQLIAFLRNYFAKDPSKSEASNFHKVSIKSLLSMKLVLEALLYIAFIFVLPLLLLPGGFQFFFQWLSALLCLQLWPALFTVLDFVLALIAKAYLFETVFSEISIEQSKDLEFFYRDLHNIAAMMSLSIPFLAYALFQGSLSSLSFLSQGLLSQGLFSQNVSNPLAKTADAAPSSFQNLQIQTASMPQKRSFESRETTKPLDGPEMQRQGMEILRNHNFADKKAFARNEGIDGQMRELIDKANQEQSEAKFLQESERRLEEMGQRKSAASQTLEKEIAKTKSAEKDWQYSITRVGVGKGFSQETLVYQNGINTPYESALDEAKKISSLYNREVSLFYNPSSNAKRAFTNLFQSVSTGQNKTSLLTKSYLEQELQSGKNVFVIAHSEGALNVSNAIKDLSSKTNLSLSTYGSPSFVQDFGAAKVQNFSSKNDLVSSLTKVTNSKHAWTQLEDLSGPSQYNLGGDHSFLANSYLSVLAEQGKEFQNRCLF